MNHAFKQKVKDLLQTILETLTALEQAGYLSPRVWGGLLLLSIAGLIIWAPYNLPSQADRSGPLATSAPKPSPTVYVPLRGVEVSTITDAEPLSSAPTATALLLMDLTPMPSPTPPFILHTVADNETLISIAATYDVTTEAILTANDIRDPTNLVVGDALLIPPSEGLRIPVVLHQIRPEDTLLSIASLYGSSLKDILTANPDIDPDNLPVDQKLIVPMVFNQPKPVSRPDEASEVDAYTVQSGDIPLTIANQFNVPVEFLLASNNITDATRLRVGQELIIPAYEGEYFSYPVVLHEFLEGDTLLSIAIRYGSSVKDILAINPDLVPSAIEPGQIVAVPIVFSQPKPTPEPGREEAPAPAPIEPSGPLVDLQQDMLAAINAERRANGLPSYEPDDQLNMAALKHAQDMVSRQYLAHVTPEGLTVRDRVEVSGLADAFRVGENIQVNTKPREQTVSEALRWFMSSGPHRRGILNQGYNRVGIGIVNGPPEWHTFVIVFAER